MAEVLGAVAAAAQLTATCLALIELTKQIKGRTSTLVNYQNQLLQLQHLSESISSNPLLQTPEIELHTRNIISLLSHQTLESSLSKGRVSQIILFFSQDRSIARLFIELERHKTTLSLVINEVQSRALHQIQNNLTTMSERRGTANTKASRVKTMSDNVASRSRRSELPTSAPIPSSPDPLNSSLVLPSSNPDDIATDGQGAVVVYRSGGSSQSTASSESSNPQHSWERYPEMRRAAAWMDLHRSYFGPNPPKSTYVGCESHGPGNLVNGISIGPGLDSAAEKTTASFAETYFLACTAKNGGHTVNGTEIWTHAGNEPRTYPVLEGHYVGCDLLDGDKGEEGQNSTLVNGIAYRPLPSPGGPSGHKST
jgi:hypothetical protein